MSKGIPKLTFPRPLSLEALLMAAIAFGVFWRFVNLGNREFWYDEVLSLILFTGQKIAYSSPSENAPVLLADLQQLLSLPPESGIGNVFSTIANLLRGLAGGEPHPPLFFLSQHFWLRLFGNSEAATRSLGAIESVAAIASAYGLGRVVLGHRGGLILAALLAANPFYLFHSLNLRMYGPLVLWTILSAWALLEVIKLQAPAPNIKANPEWASSKVVAEDPPQTPPSGRGGKLADGVFKGGSGGSSDWGIPSLSTGFDHTHTELTSSTQTRALLFWNLLLIFSVTAGCMTFYLFIYWLVVLGAMILFLDRRHWWQHGLLVAIGALLTTPWLLWGTRQQLRNADFGRFDASPGFLAAMLKHSRDVAEVLGIHLLLGDWITSLPSTIAFLAGLGAIAVLAIAAIALWRRGARQILGIALLLGVFPLLLALAADVIGGKFTLGFGWGRSVIFILPGCLLLIAAWIEKATGRSRALVASILLGLYLAISIGDYTLRSRSTFHQLTDAIASTPTKPTLIAMNSRAWGHVLRLAYYIPSEMPVTLLAGDASKLAPALEKVLNEASPEYDRLVWFDSAKPIWSPATADYEKKQIEAVILQFGLEPTTSIPLSGTMSFDRFMTKVYDRNSR
ncbi:MAG: hypothetical protein F6J93_07095 [Oscillatoria sp. SIO1A7]|nr:hypothetical protein [Oscillatoria sp. SIO1A7]